LAVENGVIQLSVGSYSLKKGMMSSLKSRTTTPWNTPEATKPSPSSSIRDTSSLFTAPTIISASKVSFGEYACGPTASSGRASKIPPGLIAIGKQKASANESSANTSVGNDIISKVGSPD